MTSPKPGDREHQRIRELNLPRGSQPVRRARGVKRGPVTVRSARGGQRALDVQ